MQTGKPVSNFHTTWPNHADADRLSAARAAAREVRRASLIKLEAGQAELKRCQRFH